jgi:hypothetical protein
LQIEIESLMKAEEIVQIKIFNSNGWNREYATKIKLFKNGNTIYKRVSRHPNKLLNFLQNCFLYLFENQNKKLKINKEIYQFLISELDEDRLNLLNSGLQTGNQMVVFIDQNNCKKCFGQSLIMYPEMERKMSNNEEYFNGYIRKICAVIENEFDDS